MKNFILTFVILLSAIGFAEPWLANRFAQNCAGCHAPGRANRISSDRRCTLNCQGCHANPNGGGLRNNYGKWTSERWMRSMYSDSWKINKPTPAAYDKQFYAKLLEAHKPSYQLTKEIEKEGGYKARNLKHSEEIRKKDPIKALSKKKASKFIAKNKKNILEKGLAVKATKLNPDEELYDKYHDHRWTVDKEPVERELLSISKEDPYRLEREEWITTSMDLRMFYMNYSGHSVEANNFSGMSIMNADFGLKLKPFSNNVSFVFETRYINSPKNSQWDYAFSDPGVRSAYLLWDDLPYNTYVMYGIYRPMFGHYNPDHTTLASYITGFKYKGSYKALTIGAAPNVPFINVHLLTKDASGNLDQEEGIAANLGFRFVTAGASLVFSFWSTTEEGATTTTETDMWAIDLGGMLWRTVFNLNALRVSEAKTGGTNSENAGNTYTIESKTRLWKENYLVLNYATSNVFSAVTNGGINRLNPGSTSQTQMGIKSYLYSGLEMEILASSIKDTQDGVGEENVSIAQMQLHYYF